MDLRKAYETLGLVRGSSTEEVDAAYERLREDVVARLGRVTSAAIAARYRDVRTRLDAAREAILAGPVSPDEPLAHGFEVLGLSPDASPLDVASAYVALCEEIDQEIEDAPTEALRWACLEARADVDAAYQRCALSPLRDATAATPTTAGGPPARYETQMSAEPFEAPEAPEAREPVLRIEPESPEAVSSRRARGRGLRWATVTLLLAGLVTGALWWSGVDLRANLERYLPTVLVSRLAAPGLPVELVEARTTAESLRRRVSEERAELQSRVEQARSRAEEFEARWFSADDPVERERMTSELSRLRARRELTIEHALLAERHVLSSDELTRVYERLEHANELTSAGDVEQAIAVFTEARQELEASLGQLDLVEEAVGARSEAEASLEAWRMLAASADLDELEPAVQGAEVLARARELLARGEFEAVVPELQLAAQHFAAALAEGRKFAAATRADAKDAALAAGDELPLEISSARGEEAARAGSTPAEAPAAPPVSAPPPSRERAAVKLVVVPAGDFLYGCNGNSVGGCQDGEPVGRRVALDAFRIDRTEVRVDEYRACVEAGTCTAPGASEDCNSKVPERGDHPVNCVDWRQARTYCEWVGKRLPMEREWEKAARGTDGRLYPWGNDDASCYNAVIAGAGAPGCGRGSTAPVASRAEGRSPFGLFDMAGNVLEWTADETQNRMRVVRGGSWRGDASPARTSYREMVDSRRRDAGIGFRCAQGPGLYAVSAP